MAHGTIEGRIGREERGDHGFGYDPLFLPDVFEDGRTLAEALPEEKNAVSHRGTPCASCARSSRRRAVRLRRQCYVDARF